MALADPSQSAGRFWGFLFALPMMALVLMCIVTMVRFHSEQNRTDITASIGLLVLFGSLGLLTYWCGIEWTRRLGTGGWAPLFRYSLMAGFIGGVICWLGMSIVSSAAERKLDLPDASWGDALAFLITCLGLSVYALVQGLLIRWTLKRHARRAQA